ncbi:hypothetical protein [Niveibacterium sp. SC-1]|uniref:hypothetical protein n=1 Tax=Niveibacterium sp. SC-1 TaxID=3135646 RepID=UPI00311F6006
MPQPTTKQAYDRTSLARHGISFEQAVADPLISRGLAGLTRAIERLATHRTSGRYVHAGCWIEKTCDRESVAADPTDAAGHLRGELTPLNSRDQRQAGCQPEDR